MIICFSGTGNTGMCASLLAEQLDDRVVTLTAEMLTAPYPFTVTVQPGERVIWMFPVYSWGIPPVVERFMRNAKLPDPMAAAGHYMVCTCGDDIGLTHRQWRAVMKRRGYTARTAFSVQMPNTYVFMSGFDVDSPEVERRKLAGAPERVAHIARAIEDGLGADDVVTGSWPWVKSHIIRPWFVRHAMSPKPFHATDACTGCGTCARDCPMANITMAHDNQSQSSRPHPQWGTNCAMCTACYHKCPHHAVAYGRTTRGKGQYPGPRDTTAI